MGGRLLTGRLLVGLAVGLLLAGCGADATPTPPPPTPGATATTAPTSAPSPPVAVVNGESITKDALRDRVALETFRLELLESRTREKVNAGKMSPSHRQQLLTFISQQKDELGSLAYEREIDSTLLLQLASKRGVEVTAAEIDAQVAKDATTPESRHTYQIRIVPETTAGAAEPTPAQKDAARKKAASLLADLTGGKTWEEVVKASGDADAAETNGDLFFIEKGATSPNAPFVEAIFALAAPGLTAVIEGDDGIYRIGRMTEVAAEVVDPNYLKRATDAGVSEAAYRRSAASVVARDEVQAQLLAEVVDKPSEQRHIIEIALEDNGGSPIAPGAVLVKHLLYSPKDDAGGAAALPAGDPAWKAAEDEARKAYDDLTAGTARFVDLAPGSDDATSAAANGFLPYFVKDDPATQLDQAFADAIFAEGLVPGQLLAPVRSAFGWHVIEFVTAEDPVVRYQKLIAEASKPGADVGKLAAESSIAASAKDGGDQGWIARYQLAKDLEGAIFATQVNGVSTAVTGTGLLFYVVTEIATRAPDPEQAKTLRDSAFVNWYQGVKNDEAQTKIERLLDGPLPTPTQTPTPKIDPSVGLKIGAPYTLAPFDTALAATFEAATEQSLGSLLVDAQIGGRQIMSGTTFAGVVIVFEFPGTSLDDVPWLLDSLASIQASDGKVSKQTILEIEVRLGQSGRMYWAIYRRGESIVIVDAPTAIDAEAIVTALIKVNQ